jgi:hypothetical protein
MVYLKEKIYHSKINYHFPDTKGILTSHPLYPITFFKNASVIRPIAQLFSMLFSSQTCNLKMYLS